MGVEIARIRGVARNGLCCRMESCVITQSWRGRFGRLNLGMGCELGLRRLDGTEPLY